MKTRESKVLWDPQEKEQDPDKNNVNLGKDQLKRDALRFLEIVPELKMVGQVDIHLKLAFPLALSCERGDILNKEDFQEGNEEQLLEALGIPIRKPGEQASVKAQNDYKQIACRYLGAHSQVQSKSASDALIKGFNELELAVRGTDSGLEANVKLEEAKATPVMESIQNVIFADPLMQQIKTAKENAKEVNVFQKNNPGIKLNDLKIGKNKRISDSKSGTFPVFGRSLAHRVLEIIDDQLCHQGKEKILEKVESAKLVFFSEIGEHISTSELVQLHVEVCEACQEVKELISLCPETSQTLVEVPEEHINRVLHYADKKHQGFAEAYTRIKSWCDFPNFKEKVGPCFDSISV